MILLLAIIITVYTGSGFILLYKAGLEKSSLVNRRYAYIQSAMFFVAAFLFSTILFYLVTRP